MSSLRSSEIVDLQRDSLDAVDMEPDVSTATTTSMGARDFSSGIADAVKVATYWFLVRSDVFPIELSFWLRDSVTLGPPGATGALGAGGGGTCTKSLSGDASEVLLFCTPDMLMRDSAVLMKLIMGDKLNFEDGEG